MITGSFVEKSQRFTLQSRLYKGELFARHSGGYVGLKISCPHVPSCFVRSFAAEASLDTSTATAGTYPRSCNTPQTKNLPVSVALFHSSDICTRKRSSPPETTVRSRFRVVGHGEVLAAIDLGPIHGGEDTAHFSRSESRRSARWRTKLLSSRCSEFRRGWPCR